MAGLVTLSGISAHLFYLQLIWVFLGVGIIALFFFIDWRILVNYRWLIGGIYAVAILLLVFVYFKGPVVRNVRGWIAFGSFTFQPVELAKIALIFLYASFFSRRHLGIAQWRNIITSFVFFIVPAGLVALQPDLGSSLILFGIWFGFLLLSGLPPKRVLTAFIFIAVASFFMWTYVLHDYQRARILGTVYPERDVLGINYSASQSKIAIGSASFWGKGYGQGSQTHLGFLTEPEGDFILAAFIEEWGFAGAMVVVASFLFLVFRMIKIGYDAETNFEKFICLGGATVMGFQFLLNAGSAVGLTPVIGVTFPFLSYGGSNLVISFFLLSIINAISRK